MFEEFKTNYEYLRPPIDIQCLEREQIYYFGYEQSEYEKSRDDRLIYYDKKDWTSGEHEELSYWKGILKDRQITLSSWWDDEEILRYMWTQKLGTNPDVKFTSGFTRLEWIQMFDKWISHDLNYDLTQDQKNLLIAGEITILGRDKYYRPVVYISLRGIDQENYQDYAKVLDKVVAIARTYMCIPTKIENIWVVLNNDNRNTLGILKLCYEVLQSIRLINRVLYSQVNVNVGDSFDLIWKAVMSLGLVHDSYQNRIQVIQSHTAQNFQVLVDLIDQKYLPKDCGGEREEQYPLTWPPNFPLIENYDQLITKSMMIDYGFKPFYFPCDEKYLKDVVERFGKQGSKIDYSALIGKDSKLFMDWENYLRKNRKNDFYINIESKNQLADIIVNEKAKNKVDSMVGAKNILFDIKDYYLESRAMSISDVTLETKTKIKKKAKTTTGGEEGSKRKNGKKKSKFTVKGTIVSIDGSNKGVLGTEGDQKNKSSSLFKLCCFR